jgi:hypothetical protein
LRACRRAASWAGLTVVGGVVVLVVVVDEDVVVEPEVVGAAGGGAGPAGGGGTGGADGDVADGVVAPVGAVAGGALGGAGGAGTVVAVVDVEEVVVVDVELLVALPPPVCAAAGPASAPRRATTARTTTRRRVVLGIVTRQVAHVRGEKVPRPEDGKPFRRDRRRPPPGRNTRNGANVPVRGMDRRAPAALRSSTPGWHGNSVVVHGVATMSTTFGSEMVRCRSCGEPVDSRRVELGYDYCTQSECQLRCVERVELASIGINKAADYYVRAGDVLPPPRPDRGSSAAPDADELGTSDRPSRVSTRETSEKRRTTTSTLERLRRLERQLDADLERSYARFAAGELTARELDRERDGLVRAFNSRVTAENIRYRSLLRKTGRV